MQFTSAMTGLTVLLTGCAGYIGPYLCRRLRDAGAAVIGLDREACEPGLVDEFFQCDLLDVSAYAGVLPRVDHICHLAAARGDWGISEDEYYRDNLEATTNLITAARQAGVKSWIFYSTVAALGPSEKPLSEEAPLHAVIPYGTSKAECESAYWTLSEEMPDATIYIIRPSVVFSPANPPNTNIFRLIDTIYRNRFVMIGDGLDVKTTSYLENLIEAHMFLMERQIRQAEPGVKTFHYVDEPAETTQELVANIYQLLNKRGPTLRFPSKVASSVAKVADVAADLSGVDLPITSARIRKFCTPTNFSAQKIRDLGFTQPVSNEEALRQTVAWYLNDYCYAQGWG